MPRDGSHRGTLDEPLNADQRKAEAEIMESVAERRTHLLTGDAGSGKTFLVQTIARSIRKRKLKQVLTAPTHKAVAVLAKKLTAAGIDDVPCRTVQSLLSLKPRQMGDRQVFERDKNAPPVEADVVFIDESSMLSEDLMQHVRLHLPNAAVLFIGDPAQLPPVGEDHSEAFDTPSRSHLGTIVRQGADNPLLDAAGCLRRQQGGPADWSWVRPAKSAGQGIYLPGDRADDWMRKAFTSDDFKADTESFRYLCWTNKRVADVNAKVRSWIYGGPPPTPFMPGERALFRAPVMDGDTVLVQTNEEATVETIAESELPVKVPRCRSIEPWEVTVPTWAIRIVKDDGLPVDVHAIRGDREYLAGERRLKAEAGMQRQRWGDFQRYKERFARVQNIYANTVHTSQGSTHRHVFVDIPEMRRWSQSNVLEAQRGCYVAVTRPTHAAILVGVPHA